MGNRDFAAYEAYTDANWRKDEPFLFIPRSDNDDPKNPTNFFMLLDLAATARFRNKREVADALSYQDETTPYDGLLERLQQQITGKKTESTNVTEFMRVAAKDPTQISERNFALPDYNISVVDSRRTGITDLLRPLIEGDVEFRNISPENEQSLNEFVRHHEAAHTILGLQEAGSDFMAAVTILKNNDTPEAREALQIFADFRLLTSDMGEEYGVECKEAIEMALDADPEELRRLPIETLYQVANNLDIKNQTMDQMRAFVKETPERGEFSLGFSSLSSFLGKCWDQVKEGNIPKFGEIYKEVKDEDLGAQQRTRRDYETRLHAEEQYYLTDRLEAVGRIQNYIAQPQR